MPVRVRSAVHALRSPSNLKPIFCRPSTAVLPVSFSIPWPKLGAWETGPTCSSFPGRIMTRRRAQFVGDVAEAAVLSARHGDHVKWLQHEPVLASIAPGDLETAGE